MEHAAQPTLAAVMEPVAPGATRSWPARHPLSAAQRVRVHDVLVRRVRGFLAQEGYEEVPAPAPRADGAARDAAEAVLRLEVLGDPALAHPLGQLRLGQLLAAGRSRVFCAGEARGGSCRADESREHGHIETGHLETEHVKMGRVEMGSVEMGWLGMSLDELCDFQERLLKHVSVGLHADLIGGPNATRIDRMLRGGHPRLTYREALAVLNRRGLPLAFGDGLDRAAEAALVHHCGNRPLQITHRPASLEFFDVKIDRGDPAVAECAGYILPFAGETVRGSVHEPDHGRLARRFRGGPFRARLLARARELAGQHSLEQPEQDREEIRGAFARMYEAAVERAFAGYLACFEPRPIERAGSGLEVGRLLQYVLGLESPPIVMA